VSDSYAATIYGVRTNTIVTFRSRHLAEFINVGGLVTDDIVSSVTRGPKPGIAGVAA
jgi:hypothetical protein